MAKFKDYSDQRFGRLVAMSFVGRKHHSAVWLFKCDCGSETSHQFRMSLANTVLFVRVDGGSRRSLRSARLSRAEFGCTLATPLLALRTWEVDMIPAQCHQLRGPKTVARFALMRFASV